MITAVALCRAGHGAAEKTDGVLQLGIWGLSSCLHQQKLAIGHHLMAVLVLPTHDHQK